jgi:hypothetical protein
MGLGGHGRSDHGLSMVWVCHGVDLPWLATFWSWARLSMTWSCRAHKICWPLVKLARGRPWAGVAMVLAGYGLG